uniref:Uncharacterized protein n=1 Tax=Oryza brachyantha TaxID=4533 RepID=J3LBX2_ORYBR
MESALLQVWRVVMPRGARWLVVEGGAGARAAGRSQGHVTAAGKSPGCGRRGGRRLAERAPEQRRRPGRVAGSSLGRGRSDGRGVGERVAPDLARADAELLEERRLVVEGGAGVQAVGRSQGHAMAAGISPKRGRRLGRVAGSLPGRGRSGGRGQPRGRRTPSDGRGGACRRGKRMRRPWRGTSSGRPHRLFFHRHGADSPRSLTSVPV